jgi:hypothetical protein
LSVGTDVTKALHAFVFTPLSDSPLHSSNGGPFAGLPVLEATLLTIEVR